MGRTACTEPQYLYKGVLYFFYFYFTFTTKRRKIRETLGGGRVYLLLTRILTYRIHAHIRANLRTKRLYKKGMFLLSLRYLINNTIKVL